MRSSSSLAQRTQQRFVWPLLIVLLSFNALPAQDDPALSQRQSGVAERYEKLEELLLRLADVEADENPERSALLRRAARQSRDQFVLEKLRVAAQSLQTQEFQKAVDNQEAAETELDAILRLLLSEDRSQRIRDEKERYQRLIKDLKRNLNNQRSARARTENGADLDEVQKEQKSVTERSQELKNELSRENETEDSREPNAEQSEPAESQPKESQSPPTEPTPPSESPPSESPPSESPPSESPPSESPPSESPPSESPPSESPPSESPPSQQQPESPEREVEKQLEDAIKKMRQAEQELERAKREEATQQQRQAEENLRAAIDRLEQILRQLREEELQRELARLEARLRKIAAMQTKVLDDTVALAQTPVSQRNRQTDVKAGDLAFEEKKITMETDRAMLLLREEGSSVAFPEMVAQIRSDTVRVAELLGQTKIDAVTQGIQQDILTALEEMIGALQKAQKDLEKQRQQPQENTPQQSGPEEQPLVEAIAELKLIRTMEVRIKSTTDRYAALIESGDSSVQEMLPLLQELSERQDRIDRITRDLVLKRNQ